MFKAKKKYYFFFLIIILTIILILINKFVVGEDRLNSIKKLLNQEQRFLIKKYIFPYKLISQLDAELKIAYGDIRRYEHIITETKERKFLDVNKLELEFKNSLENILIENSSEKKIEDNTNLLKLKLSGGFYSGIHKNYPGFGYIDFHEDKLLILSSKGVFAYSELIENTLNENSVFYQIQHNLNDFIGLEQFDKDNVFSFKDILVANENIFVSYTKEKEKDCWNTSLLYGKLNFEKIDFSEIFLTEKCIHSKNNIDKEFQPAQSGGRIVHLDNNKILFSVGEYRSRYLAQEVDNINGKILQIDLSNPKDFKIISMGHRNPQGLYYDKENNFIIETEHGPQGGDEINLIRLNAKEPLNYGWPIASYGEHYGAKSIGAKNEKKYEKYPLLKSHIKNGFVEPLYSFQPSIAISELTKISSDEYIVSSLKDESLIFFKLNDKKDKAILFKKIKIGERIRDIKLKNNKLFMFLEDTASIGIVNLI